MQPGESTAKGVWIEPSGEGKALVVDGTVQSVSLASPESVFGYWPLLLPEVRPRRALLLGLGGGTVAQLLLRRFGPFAIIGVDDNPTVIELAVQELGLDPNAVEIVIADAFAYVAACRERFDYIVIDLYRGGAVPSQVFTVPFLRQLRRLLYPRGHLALNLVSDPFLARRIERLARFFWLERTQTIGKNVVIHARDKGGR